MKMKAPPNPPVTPWCYYEGVGTVYIEADGTCDVHENNVERAKALGFTSADTPPVIERVHEENTLHLNKQSLLRRFR